jgi:hypothetical protein
MFRIFIGWRAMADSTILALSLFQLKDQLLSAIGAAYELYTPEFLLMLSRHIASKRAT